MVKQFCLKVSVYFTLKVLLVQIFQRSKYSKTYYNYHEKIVKIFKILFNAINQ